MLQIDNLVFNAWNRRFFDSASVSLPVGAKVGLVGRNGVGKTTLFKLILGELVPDGGDISLPKTARIASVDQEHPASPASLLDTILAADLEREALNGELETAPPERLGDIYARLIEIDADRAPARAAEILAGLGFSTADLARPMAEFSGGWRMRVALASALFAEPDLLLLDEPTNYLDLEGALWLEARLKKYPHAALIISHDRELLNRSVDAILHDPPRFGIAGELYSQVFYDHLARVIKRKGRLFHYTGTPNKLTSGRDVPNEVAKRLRQAGFATELVGDGIVASRR